jgi:hypothetical protein
MPVVAAGRYRGGPACRFAVLSAALWLAALPSAAHHGPSVYDQTKTVTVEGAVTQYHFVNPHVLIYVSVVGEDGASQEWSGELTSPNRLARMGTNVTWHKDLLAPGDRITLTGNPARNGAPVLLLQRIVDEAGTVLISGGR